MDELQKEVQGNAKKIEQLSGCKPTLFRAGTAYYDAQAVDFIQKMGYTPVGFNVNGDGGASYSAKQIKKQLLTAKPGSIILLHMNRPQGFTAEGLLLALPELKQRGMTFVTLDVKGLH